MLWLGACPLLCGGHGDYKNGECECHPGWKGKECSLRHDECEVADCSGLLNDRSYITKFIYSSSQYLNFTIKLHLNWNCDKKF